MSKVTDRADGFDEAFPALFAGAYRVAYRLLGDITDAEDVAAAALARAVVAWPRVGGQSYREAWVARVAANLAIDEQRRRKRRRHPEADLPTDPCADTAVAVDLVAELRRLPRRQQEVVALRFLADFPEADVASLLGITVNSVHTHATRALAALRQRLDSNSEVNLVLE
ncbi:MAG: sigma-70 family RNA polymerase sigma factor [Actinomycetota bacterium]|nr:sigma-70 family RNA polymerase sigma factor [Actinomycetota bacterium]